LSSALADRRLAVCVGPGGVGKTTVAAALALHEARAGRQVLVLTIDPARRLAQALGLEGLGDAVKEIDLSSLGADANAKGGSLSAAMFDQAESMDHLMRRVSPDAATRDGILQNRVYRAMAGSLARSHAYLAMERLYEVMGTGDYDLVVLDTPPARNALDILDAPGRLMRFLEEGVVKWFVGSERKGLAGRLFATGGAAATKLFGMVVGKELLEETLAFFRLFAELRHGFRDRATQMQARLREPTTAFVLVTSAESTHLDDARALAESIASRGVSLRAAAFNRSYERLGDDPREVVTRYEDDLASAVDKESLGHEASAELVEGLAGLMRRTAERNARSQAAVDGLLSELPETCQSQFIPWLDHDIRDLPGLAELDPYMGEET
jgi:anion-transporting  ArsA/GET3 family ATPase